MVLAESVSLDGGAIAFILGILALALVGLVLLVVGGFRQARRSGRGQSPIGLWLALVVAELVVLSVTWRSWLAVVVLGGSVVGQVVVHLRERRDSGR